jgi:hypothetical protein
MKLKSFKGVDSRPYRSIDAVAAVGSKYFINAACEIKSLGSGTAFAFLADLPVELTEVCRCRDIAW